MEFDARNLPFTTREMLNFPAGSAFRLNVIHQATDNPTVQIVGATKDGTFTFSFIADNTNVVTPNTFGLSDVPLWVSARIISAGIPSGTLYVRCQLQINNDNVVDLFSGYITSGASLSWPFSSNMPSTPLVGQVSIITGANPAAGSEISATVPARFLWKIKAVIFSLVTSATAATRQVHLQYNQDADIVWDLPSAVTQTASLTRVYTWMAGGGIAGYAADNDIFNSLPPDLYLHPTAIIQTATDNLQVGDDFGAPFIWVERYLVNQTS